MWLFEVLDSARPGFRITLRSGCACVHMGVDDQNRSALLPLGHSLERLLVHDEDQTAEFVLLRAQLKETTAGLCLTRQSEEEAQTEQRALVLFDTWNTDGCVTGAARLEVAYGYPMPDLVTYTKGRECQRGLYVFKPGDAIYIHWVGDKSANEPEKRFILRWDGSQMQERLCRRRGPRRLPHRQPAARSAEEHQRRAVPETKAQAQA